MDSRRSPLASLAHEVGNDELNWTPWPIAASRPSSIIFASPEHFDPVVAAAMEKVRSVPISWIGPQRRDHSAKTNCGSPLMGKDRTDRSGVAGGQAKPADDRK